jgi:hypothetical protein
MRAIIILTLIFQIVAPSVPPDELIFSFMVARPGHSTPDASLTSIGRRQMSLLGS